MAAVIVPKNSAANAVPYDASIPPNFHLYIKVTVWKSFLNEALRWKKTYFTIPIISNCTIKK